MNENKGLLEGIVVLDLTRVLAGPYCGTLIADMGATVIKVENPTGGDDSRSMGPFINGNSVYYANFNRSKLGCTLNLKTSEGKEIFKELVKKADIIIENYRPGTMEKLGLGYDELKKVNPAIIYGAVSGFGHTGPLSKSYGRINEYYWLARRTSYSFRNSTWRCARRLKSCNRYISCIS